MINQKFKEKTMSTEKNNDKNEKNTVGGCCDGTATEDSQGCSG
jgi:hypothetical protein